MTWYRPHVLQCNIVEVEPFSSIVQVLLFCLQTEVCLGILESDGCDGPLANAGDAFTLHHFPFKRRSSQRCQVLAKSDSVVGGKCSSCRESVDRTYATSALDEVQEDLADFQSFQVRANPFKILAASARS